jgi:cysteine sulfinate desulfinase/cysteine desulfurase-like protein
MGLKKPVVDGSLRFSFGRLTTAGEIDRAVLEITRIFMRFSPRKEDQKTASRSSR